MKSKNISFAQVLKNKSRSPQLPPKNSSSRLIDLLERWQQCPQEDFTLYLGSVEPIQRSQFSTSRMFCSNNRREGEQFDSWIQKQSTVAPSKEYKTVQSQRHNKNQFYQFPQSSTNVNFSSKSKESGKGARSIADQVRRNDALHIENSSQYSNLGGNIQMIKSKTCENQNANLKSSNNRPKMNPQTLDMQITSVEREQNFTGLNDRKRQITQQNKSSLSFKTANEVNNKKQDIQQIIDSTANIHYQIADLAKKYLTEEEECNEEMEPKFNSVKKPSRDEEQQQELLIDNSDRKPLGDEMNDEPMFSEEYVEKIRKTEEMERIRKQEAKNMIKNLMKDNFSKHSRKGMQFVPPKELKMENIQEEQPIVKIVPNSISVGYSFASNHPQNSTKFEFEPKQYNFEYNQQVKSQFPSAGIQNEDAQFMRKYVKSDDNITPTQSIKNIQSIQYQIRRSYRQEQAKVDENIPNTSFQAKLIRTQIEQSHNNNFAFLKKSENQYYDTKYETNKAIVEASLPKVEYFGGNKASHTQQFGKFPHQKIKIVSSSKNRFGSNKSSNKSSPAQKSPNEAPIPTESIKQVKTQPFVSMSEAITTEKPYSQVKSPEQQRQVVRQGLSPFKTIKEVKNSIVNPIKSPEPQVERMNSPAPQSNLSNFQIIPREGDRGITTEYASPKYEMPKSDEKAYEPSYVSNYNQPSYGKTTIHAGYTYYKTGSSNSNYVSSPTNYAIPTPTVQPYSSTFTSTTQNSTTQYLNGYGMTQQTSPTVVQLKQKYASKYTVISNPAFETCQKFDALISQSRKEFPQLSQTEKQIIPPTYETKPIAGKRSYLAQLDIKQSINIDELKKRQNANEDKQNKPKQSVSVIHKKEAPSIFNKSISNSLKQSINLKASGQFDFDF